MQLSGARTQRLLCWSCSDLLLRVLHDIILKKISLCTSPPAGEHSDLTAAPAPRPTATDIWQRWMWALHPQPQVCRPLARSIPAWSDARLSIKSIGGDVFTVFRCKKNDTQEIRKYLQTLSSDHTTSTVLDAQGGELSTSHKHSYFQVH